MKNENKKLKEEDNRIDKNKNSKVKKIEIENKENRKDKKNSGVVK